MTKNNIETTSANEVVKQELANKNSLDLTTTDAKAVANRLRAIDTLGDAIKSNLVEGINDDYAIIPHTSKPSLLQPGARKICMLYGLTTQYPDLKVDKEGNIVTVKCELYYQGMKVSESYGAMVIETPKDKESRQDYGWKLNRSIKLAQKRAFVGATLQIANLSKLFTQDTEDMQPVKDYTQEQKKATYEVASWFYKKCNLPMRKTSFKDNWAKFCSAYSDFLKSEKLDEQSVYELGANQVLVEPFKKWVIDNKTIENCFTIEQIKVGK